MMLFNLIQADAASRLGLMQVLGATAHHGKQNEGTPAHYAGLRYFAKCGIEFISRHG